MGTRTATDIDTREMAVRLRLSATRLARQLRKQSGTGLTPSQFSALATVDRHGSLTLGELADHERVAPPSITRVVVKLEQQGLLHREIDSADRRIGRLALTAKGTSILARSRKRRNEWLASRLQTLTAHELVQLEAALGVLETLTLNPPERGRP